jgi:hypothetical protein
MYINCMKPHINQIRGCSGRKMGEFNAENETDGKLKLFVILDRLLGYYKIWRDGAARGN